MEPAPVPERRAFPPYTRRLFLVGLLLGLVPVIALAAALALHHVLFLVYVHVISGGTWTGIDLFMGAVMTRVLGSMEPPHRAEFLKRFVPAEVFFMPAIASVAVTAGVTLAQWQGRLDLHSPLILFALAAVAVLLVQGFGVFLPNSVRVFFELGKERPDTGKIVRLSMRNLRLAGVQAAFQVLIILDMVLLRFS